MSARIDCLGKCLEPQTVGRKRERDKGHGHSGDASDHGPGLVSK